MKFKWAVCQHPMTLIIKEDESSLERVPPYGAESFHAYYLKIKENLEYLKKNDFAKVCFETSILETMMVLDEYPEIKNDFIELVKNKKISFVGGTYAQSHTHTLTSESNYRQLQEGLKGYKNLFGVKIKLYAVQEPGHHEQMPQLLKCFGLKFATLPAFTYSLIFLEEYELVSFMEMAWMKFTKERGMEQDQIDRICFTNGNEFAGWSGLDGTEMPVYLIDPMRWCRKEDIRNEFKKDLYSSPPVRIYLTDLLDFNPAIVGETLEHSEYALADQAIEERFKGVKEAPIIRLYSYYSYLEGSKLDGAYVKNRQIEDKILAAQALEAYLVLNKARKIPEVSWDKIWKTVLETQHHDICYPLAPVLQKWAINKIHNEEIILDSKIEALKDCLIENFKEGTIHTSRRKPVKERIKMPNNSTGDAGTILIFNPEPHLMKSYIKVIVPEALLNYGLELYDRKGPLDFQVERHGDFRCLVFYNSINGFGTKTIGLKKKSKSLKEQKSKTGFIENDFYSLSLNGHGDIFNVILKKNGKILFKEPANKLTASFNNWSHVKFKKKPATIEQINGRVYDLFTCKGVFDKSSYKKEIKFYKTIPRIDFKIVFNFKNQQIGDFFLEEKKLCTTWPVKDLVKIKHDIAFGVVKARKSRPLYAINWINCEIINGIFFTILPAGKIKFFEKDGILYNLLGWGDEGVDFMRVGGTCAPEILQGHFDLRLNGEYAIEYALYIHEEKPSNLELFNISASYKRPFIANYVDIPCEMGEDIVFKFNNSNISSTSIFREDGKIKCRFFECNATKENIKILKSSSFKIKSVRDAFGQKIENIEPFRIGTLST